MASHSKRLKAGDLLKVAVGDGTAYLQYLGKHRKYGDVIRVLRAEDLPGSESDLEAAVSVGYVAFYPARAALREGLVEVVGHYDSHLEQPEVLRRAGARAKDGTVLTWVIERDGGQSITKSLTAEERTLPVAAIWNHEMLCTRLREGWRPEREGAS